MLKPNVGGCDQRGVGERGRRRGELCQGDPASGNAGRAVLFAKYPRDPPFQSDGRAGVPRAGDFFDRGKRKRQVHLSRGDRRLHAVQRGGRIQGFFLLHKSDPFRAMRPDHRHQDHSPQGRVFSAGREFLQHRQLP